MRTKCQIWSDQTLSTLYSVGSLLQSPSDVRIQRVSLKQHPQRVFGLIKIISCCVLHVIKCRFWQCPDLILLTFSGVHMWKQLPSAVVRQSKLLHWTPSCWNGVILPWETGQPSPSQPCRFFQSKAESCSRRRQKGWTGDFSPQTFLKTIKKNNGV